MDSVKLFKTLGGIAGLAGLAFGVFLLIFQGVLRQKFLPAAGLDSTEAYSLIMALMVLTFGLASLGVVTWLIVESLPAKGGHLPPYVVLVLGVLFVSVLVTTVIVGAAVRNRSSPVLTITPPPTQPKQEVTRSFKVCTGEYERACDPHDAYLYCYVDPATWAQGRCDRHKIQQLNSRGGNKCGYQLYEVLCTSTL